MTRLRRLGIPATVFCCRVLCAVCLCASATAGAVTLGVADVSGVSSGQSAVLVTMSLANDASHQIAAIQADVAFDATVLTLESVAAGEAATNAHKTVQTSVLAVGSDRVLIAGLNQNVIADGEVAILTFSVAETAAAGSYPITLSNVRMTSASGTSISAEAVSGSVEVAEGGEGEGESEGEGEGEGESSEGCLWDCFGKSAAVASDR